MRQLRSITGLFLLACVALLIGGCLISGTFVTDIMILEQDFTTQNLPFYYYFVDLTEDETWEDHADNIKSIDLVGFELWITNHEASDRTFSIWIDDAANPALTTLSGVQANTTKILDGLTIAASTQTYVSYPESFKYIRNLDQLLALLEVGEFHFYGISDGGDTAGYTIDSARVIITFTAGS